MKYLYALIVLMVGFAAVGHYHLGLIGVVPAATAVFLTLKYGPKP